LDRDSHIWIADLQTIPPPTSVTSQQDALPHEDLSIPNQSPVFYLAGLGVRCGATREASFDHATRLVLAFGSSRRIRQDEATDLCAQIRAWADANPGR
jgi:hypothetical protein